MPSIERIERIAHERLPGVAAYLLQARGDSAPLEELLVEVEPNGEVPLHSHSVDATMIILDGAAEVLSEDHDLNGKQVSRGDVVLFEKDRRHGFKVSDSGLLFLSRNGGIVGKAGRPWDISFAQ
jgi:quercetin dioxygenase-like cupin family protein